MISTVAFNTEAEIAQICVQPETGALEGSYATAPMAAVLPAYQPPSDEELHSLFEEAISSRLGAVNTRLERLNSISHATIAYRSSRAVRPSSQISSQGQYLSSLLPKNGRTLLMQLGLGLVFLLSGFDLMGLLVLHMR